MGKYPGAYGREKCVGNCPRQFRILSCDLSLRPDAKIILCFKYSTTILLGKTRPKSSVASAQGKIKSKNNGRMSIKVQEK